MGKTTTAYEKRIRKPRSVMKVVLTIRKRIKTDGISGIASSVQCLCDLQVGNTERGQINLEVPPAEYDQFEPGSMWSAELVRQ